LKTLRLQLTLPAAAGATLVVAAYLAVPLLDQVTLRWFSRDLNSRGALVTNALSDSVAQRRWPRVDRTPGCGAVRPRGAGRALVAIGLCRTDGRLLQRTDPFPSSLTLRSRRRSWPRSPTLVWIWPGGNVHVGVHEVVAQRRPVDAAATPFSDPSRTVRWIWRPPPSPRPDLGPRQKPSLRRRLDRAHELVARLVLLHDLSFIERRSQDTRRYLIGLITALGLVIAH
jgi:hypothetical protein